jgi:hypothetical protein
MTDLEILNREIGGQKIFDMSAITFIGWILGKLNGLNPHEPAVIELRYYASSPVIGKMPEYKKIELVRKLLTLNVPI